MNTKNWPRVGIVGDGQLARMLALAAAPLGIETVVFGSPKSPAGQVTSVIEGDFRDAQDLARFCKDGGASVVTTEFEDANPEGLLAIQASGTPVWPDPRVTIQIKDKFKQKVLLTAAGVPTCRHVEISEIEDVHRFAEEVGYPVVLKARHGSYDGTGNRVVRTPNEVEAIYKELTATKGAFYAEAHVAFEYEAAIIFARNASGEIQMYDPVVTTQQNGVCAHVEYRSSLISPSVDRQARELATKLIERLQPVGVTAIEFFVDADGSVLFNEMAPRVHNSGHLTIEASTTSQFTNHLLAILDLPLGRCGMMEAAMVNVLGRNTQAITVPPVGLLEAASKDGSCHWYGKAEARPGRKLGHITVLGPDALYRALTIRESIKL